MAGTIAKESLLLPTGIFPGAILPFCIGELCSLWTLIFGILAVLESLLGSTPLHIQSCRYIQLSSVKG